VASKGRADRAGLSFGFVTELDSPTPQYFGEAAQIPAWQTTAAAC
jgi:hypothetical protein